MAAPQNRYWLLPFRDEPLFFAAGLVVLATVIFLALPGLDIAFSRFFYDSAKGGFFAAANPRWPAAWAMRGSWGTSM